MRKVEFTKHTKIFGLISILLISTIGFLVVADYIWPRFTIPFEVDEPIEIKHYTSQMSLFPGETKEIEVTVENHASLTYNLSLDFHLSDAAYQRNYVTFSDEIYAVAPGEQIIAAWAKVRSSAPAINCTLTIDLKRIEGPTPSVYEDFADGTWSEFDPNNHIGIVGSNHISFACYRNERAYVCNDKGNDYFGLDWTIEVDVKLGDHYDNGLGNFFALTNEVDDWWTILKAGGYELCAFGYYHSTRGYVIAIREGYEGVEYQTMYNVQANKWYYCTIERSGLTLSMYIYADNERTDLLDTITLSLHDGHSRFRYIFAAQTYDIGNEYFISLAIENLGLK